MISQTILVTKNYSYTKDIYNIYKNYVKYVFNLSLSEDTKNWRCKHIRGFLYFIDNKNISIKSLNTETIYDYMMSIDNYSTRTKEHRAVCIRLFLNYLYDKKIIKITGSQVFPKIKCNKEVSIPSYYTEQEINIIINAVNPKCKNGKRDLVILLLLAKLGLRPRDIRYLKIKNIYWQENKIKILQSKTNYVNILPIDKELRYAILDYLKNERPNVVADYLFINELGEVYTDRFFYDIVNEYISKSKIDIGNRRHGTYIFRHSLAKQILDNNNGINVVADILGHSNIDNAKYYAKIDKKELQKISLEVPTCEN